MNKIKIGVILKGLGAYNAHIKPIVDNNLDDNFRFIVFYLNKYFTSNDSTRDERVILVNLVETKDIKNILNKYEIQILLSINPGNIFDLFLLTIAKLNNIVTIYYQHGLQLDFTTFDPKTLNQSNSNKRRINTIKKYLFFYKVFLKVIIQTSFNKYLLKTLFIKSKYNLRSKNIEMIPKYGLKENHCDYAFVFGKIDKEYLISSMNMNPERIIISGYPFVKENEQVELIPKRAVFLSTALRTAEVTPMTIDEEKEYYRKIQLQVEKAGYNLIIKLHPLEDEQLFKTFFIGNSVKVLKEANLSDLIKSAEIVIGEYTTAFFYAIKYIKPIYIVESKYFDNYPFDFTNHGIGTKCKVENLATCIINDPGINTDIVISYQEFQNNYIKNEEGVSSFSVLFNKLISLNSSLKG